MNKRKLTQKAVNSARYEGDGRRPYLIADAAMRGLSLRIHPSGQRAYVLRYRNLTGRQRWLSIGRADVLTLVQARRRSQELLAQVISGCDPVEDLRQARRAGAFSELAQRYLDEHAARKITGHDDAQRLRDHVLPALGRHAALDVKRGDVSRLHTRLGDRVGNATANRVLSLIGGIYSWGEKTGALPAGTLNPCKGIKKLSESSRDRWLTRDEVRRVFKALNNEPSPWLRALFALLLLTGCRKSELLSLRWQQVDLEGGTLRILKTKTGRDHYVPLSGPARTLLESVPREPDNPFVFVGAKKGAALVNVAKPWRRVCEAAGIDDIRIHDLRRTVGSWLAQSGRSLEVVGAVLNHSNAGTTKVYARLAPEQAREALDAHSIEVLDVANDLMRIGTAG